MLSEHLTPEELRQEIAIAEGDSQPLLAATLRAYAEVVEAVSKADAYKVIEGSDLKADIDVPFTVYLLARKLRGHAE
jgi:hypothetical protein